MGDGTTSDRLTPVRVQGLTNVAQVTADGDHSCAVLTDGTARCWGRNDEGQLGDGTTTQRNMPVQVQGLTNIAQITAGGFHSCAVLTDGTAHCWGSNNVGQLGDGTTTNRLTPVRVQGLTNAAQITVGLYHSCAQLTDGTARCWGDNYHGQLGNGEAGYYTTPRAVVGIEPIINPPRSLTASTEPGTTRVDLAWQAPLAQPGVTVTGYAILRADPDVAEREIDIVGASTTQYADVGLSAGEYTYRVLAITSAGRSTPSNGSSVAVVNSGAAPGAPTGLIAIGGPGPTEVTLDWSPPSSSTLVSSYNVYRRFGTEPWVEAGSTAGETHFVDGGLVTGERVFYAVSALNAAGEGPKSAIRGANVGERTGFVFMHGICSTKELWTTETGNGYSIWEEIALKRARPVWMATAEPEDHSTDAAMTEFWASQVEQFLADRTDIDRVVLIGHSLGGLLARNLTTTRVGDQISGIVTLDSPDIGVYWSLIPAEFLSGCSPAWQTWSSTYLERSSAADHWLNQLRMATGTDSRITRILYAQCLKNQDTDGFADCDKGNAVVTKESAVWQDAVLASYRDADVDEEWVHHARNAACLRGGAYAIIPPTSSDQGAKYHSWGTRSFGAHAAAIALGGVMGLEGQTGASKCRPTSVFASRLSPDQDTQVTPVVRTGSNAFKARCTSTNQAEYLEFMWRHTRPDGTVDGRNVIVPAAAASNTATFTVVDQAGLHRIEVTCVGGTTSNMEAWTVTVLSVPSPPCFVPLACP